TEKGLYMLATIIKGEVAAETTIKIIETFANIKKLSRNLSSVSHEQTEEEQNRLFKGLCIHSLFLSEIGFPL
ncbi:MAG: hypothetical protein DRJ29_16240, partial [Bacteroidetes bacterium]